MEDKYEDIPPQEESNSEYYARIKKKLLTFEERSYHLESTLTFLNHHFNDSQKISEYLFGYHRDHICEILEGFLQRIDLFSETEQKRMRTLLIKSSIFLREPRAWPRDEDKIVLSKCLNFDISINTHSTDVTELNKLLLSPNHLFALFKSILKIHKKFKYSIYCDNPVSDAYFIFLSYAKDFVNLFKEPELTLKQKELLTVQVGSDSYRIRPSFIIEAEGSPRIIIETSNSPLLPRSLLQNPCDIKVVMDSLETPLKQLVGYMLLVECPFGILADDDTMFFVELDHEKIDSSFEKDNRPTLPLKVFVSNIKATGPSCIESMISWQIKCLDQWHLREKMKDLKYTCFTSHLNQELPEFEAVNPNRDNDVTKIVIRHPDFSVIKAGHSRFQWFKVAALSVPFLGSRDPHEQVVIKVFDPDMSYNRLWRTTGFSGDIIGRYGISVTECLDTAYKNALMSINKLQKDPEFNNCFLHDYEVFAEVHTPIGCISGKCLVSKYIETIPLPKTQQVYTKVKKQASIVLEQGLTHHGSDRICERNILYSKKGDVYIIAFENASDAPCSWSLFHFEYDLKKLFEGANIEFGF